MSIQRLLRRLLPILPIVWIVVSTTTSANAQQHPIIQAPSQFGTRASVFSGYGPGHGYAPGIGYGYGFSPRFTPIPDQRYGYGPRLSAGFGAGIYSPLGAGPQFGYGPNFGYLGRSFGYGYGWYYPAAFGSFWTNGLTLYGPPVPTFGITPGSFGGSDAHRFYFLQSYYSMEWDAYRYKSGMPYGWEPSAKWSTEIRICASPVRLPAPSTPEQARVALRLPHPDAELWIDTVKMKSGGTEGTFETPALEPGQSIEYEFIYRWGMMAESRTVTLKRGDSVEVDFN